MIIYLILTQFFLESEAALVRFLKCMQGFALNTKKIAYGLFAVAISAIIVILLVEFAVPPVGPKMPKGDPTGGENSTTWKLLSQFEGKWVMSGQKNIDRFLEKIGRLL